VEEVHGKATQELIDLIEKQVQCRITTDGVAERVNTNNIVAACFNHYASRNVDGKPSPHIHTHVVVANMTQRPDRQWRAIANESLMERSFFISMYENQLAWHAQRTPFAHLPGLAIKLGSA